MADYMFFLNTHRAFTMTDHAPGHKKILNNFDAKYVLWPQWNEIRNQ